MARTAFMPALIAAAVVHIALATAVVVTLPGTSGQYRVPVVFWGSVLGRNDLQPRARTLDDEGGLFRFLEPSEPLSSAQSIPWVIGTGVDKPLGRTSAAAEREPPGFATARVDVAPGPVPASSVIPTEETGRQGGIRMSRP